MGVGGWGWGWGGVGGGGGFFYYQRNLQFGAHIDKGLVGFLNDSGCIFVRFL